MWKDLQADVLRTLGLYAWKIVAAALILVIGLWLARIIRGAVHRVLVSKRVDPTIIGFVDSAAHIGLYGLVIIEVLHKLGVESSTLVAAVGAAGLAVGFALRGQLANVAAGLLIIVFRPFSVGNEIEGGGSVGTVERIQLVNTEIRTPDNLTVILPNSKLVSDKIVNYSYSEKRRLDILIGVNYKADIKKVKELLLSIISENDFILKEPQPNIAVKELADKSVKIEVGVWVRSADYMTVKVQLNERIKECFDAEQIPFP
ncbi:MAG: mechanosensitive ion channel [Deltaproteobacteria bacterium]|nr:mechanosensitive ion channel [Deltaproteobacteria bacterium]